MSITDAEMQRIKDWNGKFTIVSEMINKSVKQGIRIEASLTWLEIFVGMATIVKDTEGLVEIHEQFNHMLFGYNNAFTISDSLFQEIIQTLIYSEMLELIDANNVRLTYYGIDFLMQNWLIDRSVYANTRLESDSKAAVLLQDNDTGGAI